METIASTRHEKELNFVLLDHPLLNEIHTLEGLGCVDGASHVRRKMCVLSAHAPSC